MNARYLRMMAAVSSSVCAVLLSPALAHAPAACAAYRSDAAGLTRLDYLVLASLVDSSNLLAVSAHRSGNPVADDE